MSLSNSEVLLNLAASLKAKIPAKEEKLYVRLGDVQVEAQALLDAISVLKLSGYKSVRPALKSINSPLVEELSDIAVEAKKALPEATTIEAVTEYMETAALAYGLMDEESIDISRIQEPEEYDIPEEAMPEDLEVNTGAMLSLVPGIEYGYTYPVDGGLLEADIHNTLFYLGEAEDLDPVESGKIQEIITDFGEQYEPVYAEAFAVAAFNPGSANSCIALLLSGEDLFHFRNELAEALLEAGIITVIKDSHLPWIPHVTLKYTNDMSDISEYVGKLGPVVFDRIRLAVGGSNYIVALSGKKDIADDYESEETEEDSSEESESSDNPKEED